MKKQNKGGRRKAEGGRNSVQRPRSAFLLPPSAVGLRPAVTLIELLVGMVIVAILAAAILGTAAAAMEAGRRSRTQSTITKIHNLIMDRLSDYETRRVAVHADIPRALDAWVQASANSTQMTERNVARGQMLADARLLGVRELMKMEMPDRVEDIALDPLILTARPPLSQAYFRRYQTAQAAQHDAAECLYLTVMNATGDGEARTLFREQEIGDVDQDGAPEIIDGWGRPIGWIRWPAGHVSYLQPLNPDGTHVDHDPFDHFQRDSILVTKPDIGLYPNEHNFQGTYKDNIRDRLRGPALPAQKDAFRLVPLIYSSGPDGSSAMLIAQDPTVAPLDPYYVTNDKFQAGAVDPAKRSEALDNITNHLIEY